MTMRDGLESIRRVLIVSPKGVGGIQSWSVKFAHDLQDAPGVKADVMFEDFGISDRDAGDSPRAEGVQSFVFGYAAEDNRAHVCRRLERVLAGYDAVYPNTSGMTYQAIARMGPRRPVAIGGCRGDFEHDYGTITRFAAHLDHIFSISDMCRERLCARLPGGSPAVTAITHSIDPGECNQERDGLFRIVFTGRFDRVKRIADLLAVAENLREQDGEFELVLAGDGPLHADIAAQVKERGLAKHVRLTGFLEKSGILALLGTAHVIALISERESFGLSALEGMACGAVPIITNTCGCKAAVQDSANGHVVEVGDVNAMAKRIRQMLKDRALWERLSLAARETVRREYAPERVFAQHLEVLRRALQHHREHAAHTPVSPYLFSRLDQPYLPNMVTRFIRGMKSRKGVVA